MKAITKHHIDGAFVESHGRKVWESINPSNDKVIGRLTLGDEEDARRAISALERFIRFAGTKKDEWANVSRRLHEVVAARSADPLAAMVPVYGGGVRFSVLTLQMAANSFMHAEKARIVTHKTPIETTRRRPA